MSYIKWDILYSKLSKQYSILNLWLLKHIISISYPYPLNTIKPLVPSLSLPRLPLSLPHGGYRQKSQELPGQA